jgi:3-deoxy-D-manno-octulosonate 8-phosphate phosphatase (KDO 8-P phosphatase)
MSNLQFILDVDGVMTTGQFIYSEDGKLYKVFGAHDSDGLKLLMNKIDIKFITADKRGFSITHKRIVEDMGYELKLVSECDRFEYLQNIYNIEKLIYMGDGYYDAKILEKCMFGIAPKNARKEAKECADFITESKSGEGAVLDACIEIKKRYID